MKIITAEERLAEVRGAKILIAGPPGVGKTSLLRAVDTATVLFIEVESGDLSVRDVPVDTTRPSDWPTIRDLTVRICGPNSSFPASSCYSKAHYEAVGGALPDLGRYKTIFIDSITAISRLAFRWAEQQPEGFSDRTGKKDVRGTYGLLGREMVLWAGQLQHARALNVVFIGILERVVDEFNRGEWQLQCEGSKTARELPGIIDEVITYQFLNFGDSEPPTRGFVCSTPNPWAYLGKDRSGRLQMTEPPDLGKLLAKLTNRKEQ